MVGISSQPFVRGPQAVSPISQQREFRSQRKLAHAGWGWRREIVERMAIPRSPSLSERGCVQPRRASSQMHPLRMQMLAR
eukprot:2341675-Prymnesium_polylepis.1